MSQLSVVRGRKWVFPYNQCACTSGAFKLCTLGLSDGMADFVPSFLCGHLKTFVDNGNYKGCFSVKKPEVLIHKEIFSS